MDVRKNVICNNEVFIPIASYLAQKMDPRPFFTGPLSFWQPPIFRVTGVSEKGPTSKRRSHFSVDECMTRCEDPSEVFVQFWITSSDYELPWIRVVVGFKGSDKAILMEGKREFQFDTKCCHNRRRLWCRRHWYRSSCVCRLVDAESDPDGTIVSDKRKRRQYMLKALTQSSQPLFTIV